MDSESKPKRKAKGDKFKAPVDRLPPHSPEAEQGILGCIMLSPADCIPQCQQRLRPDAECFYDLRNQTIYRQMAEMHKRGMPVDVMLLQQCLKDQRRLEEVGGISFLASLPDVVPSAANLSYYLDIVCEKYRLRKLLQSCTEIVGRVFECNGDYNAFLDQSRADLLPLFDRETGEVVHTIPQLMAYDFQHDPNAVIGFKGDITTRFLCKGYAAWLIGMSGIGKSSLLMQWAVKLASGKELFGISPGKPRRVGIIQAENDEGDTAEFTQGICGALNIGDFDNEHDYAAVCENLVIITERRTIGSQFCDFLRRMIVKHKLEIVFADPFLSFAGIDVTRLSEVSQFLRHGMNPVLHDTGAVLICAHHCGKPKFDKTRTPSALEYAYAGIGSSEIVNWGRAVMVLLPVGMDGRNFELKICKRGAKAGATGMDGENTSSIFLRHAEGRVFWEQVAAPVEPERDTQQQESKPKKQSAATAISSPTFNLKPFLAACPEGGEKFNAIVRRLRNWLTSKECIQKMDLSKGTGETVVKRLVTEGILNKVDDIYTPGL